MPQASPQTNSTPKKSAEEIHQEILSKMSPTRKWETARTLYVTAWELKASGIRMQNPIWPEERVQDAVRRIFLHGHT
jgi:hypothetical protein